MNKIDGVPFHGTPPSQKHVGNTERFNANSKLNTLAHHAGATVGTLKAVYEGYRIVRPILQTALRGARVLA